MKIKCFLFLILLLTALAGQAQDVVRHGYGVDTTIINLEESYRFIDTSFYNVFRGGQQKFTVSYEPVDSVAQIVNFFDRNLDSQFKEGISGIERVISMNSAIRLFLDAAGLYSTISPVTLVRRFGQKYGPNVAGSYLFQGTAGAPVAVTIEDINGQGNYRLIRTSNNQQWLLIPLPLECFYITNLDIGNGVAEQYFFKKTAGTFVPFEAYFNKYANVSITPN